MQSLLSDGFEVIFKIDKLSIIGRSVLILDPHLFASLAFLFAPLDSRIPLLPRQIRWDSSESLRIQVVLHPRNPTTKTVKVYISIKMVLSVFPGNLTGIYGIHGY